MNSDFGVRHPGRREAAVAVLVATLLILISWLANRSGDSPLADANLTATGTPEDAVLALDLPGQVTEDQIAACIDRPFARSADEVTVLYSTVQRTATGQTPVLVLSNEAGELRLCDANGGDSPSSAPMQYADATTPVRRLTNGRTAWECDGTRLQGMKVTEWYSVAPAVDRAELRFLIDGSPTPWFSAVAKDGFVHVHGWLDAQNEGAEVELQSRVIDAAGAPVDQDVVPTQPRDVMNCPGGSLEIG